MKKTNKYTNLGLALGMCFGVAIGTSLGSSFDNINVGNVGYRFYICKTKFSKFPDSEFYLHFVNDRTYDPRRKYKENGTPGTP